MLLVLWVILGLPSDLGLVPSTVPTAGYAANGTLSTLITTSHQYSLRADNTTALHCDSVIVTLGAGTANVQAQGPYVSGGATLLQSYAYGYSPLGVTTAISSYAATTCGGSAPTAQTLAGDAFGRLAASGGITWTYDGNDNLTSLARDPRVGGTAPLSQTYAYANADGALPAGALPNELLAVRNGSQAGVTLAAAYGYDRSGDTTAITTVNATAGTTTTRALGYDATGRLTGVSSSDGLSVTVGYNARGLRASLAVSDAHPDKGGAASFVERMTYRGDRLGQVAVVEGTASFTETFLYRADGEPLELLYQPQGQAVPTRYYYAVDGRGDVTALTDAQGQVVDQYGYDLWGAATAASGGVGALGLVVEGVPQPLRYRGYFYDAWYDGVGLWSNGAYVSKGDRPLPWYWLGVRSYDPALERFLQPDPSAQDGARSYAYCHDAPADCADPSGLVSQSTGPEPLPGVPIEPGLGAPGGAAEGAGLPVAGAGDSVAASPYDQLAYDPSRVLAAPKIADGGQFSLFPEAESGGQGQYTTLTPVTFKLADSKPEYYTDFVNAADARAQELQALVPAGARGRVTMSAVIVEDANGIRGVVIGTSEDMLRPVFRKALRPGEIFGPGAGHAEEDAVDFALSHNLQVISGGAGRPVCPECAAKIEGAGGIVASPKRPW